MATGAYHKFWKDFYITCEQYFCMDIEKGYEIFTDSPDDFKKVNDTNVYIHKIEDLGWIVNTSYKSKYICSIREELKKYDYVFYINSNFLFTAPIYAEEVLPDASNDYLTALSFDHYLQVDVRNYPYDRQPNCLAYIPIGQGKRYFQGGFYGGRTKEMLLLSDWCKEAIAHDFNKKIVARFHDESYINRYMLDKKPKVLNDGYALQHIWPYHGPHKAVVRNKEEVLGIHVLGRLKEVYTDTSLSFLLDEHLCFRPGGIVNLYGGLGNQMFGYAFCLYMQKKDSQRHWWIDAYACQNSNVHNGYELNKIFIGINASSELSEESHQKLSQVSDKYKTNIKELHLSQVQTFISSDKSLVIYNGCWQCYPYVEACADELRQQFQFDETQLNEKNKKILEIISHRCTVSVHIRRGDYLKGNNEWLYGGICTVAYYQAAMLQLEEMLPEKPYYLFFSDEPDWVKEYFNLPNSEIIDWNRKEESWQDLCLMAACRHHIIANSSFSWWGAWLGQHEDTLTIAPDLWYNTTHTPDLLPLQWIRIPIPSSVELLQRLCNELILRSSYWDSLGLQVGKMGAVLFFFHYARYTGNVLYENYAEELFDEVYNDVNKGISYGFANGLCGIGWAVEYLIKQEFIEGDTDDALEEIDRQVMVYNPTRISDYSFANGLDGIVCYVLSRLLSPRAPKAPLPFDERYRKELYLACRNIPIEERTTYTHSYINLLEKGDCDYSFNDVLEQLFELSEDVFNMKGMTWETGIKMMKRVKENNYSR